MGKYYVSSKAACPYYRGELPQLLRCGILKKGGTVQQAFGDKTEMKIYRAKHCEDDYMNCPIYWMLEDYGEK